MGVVSSYVRDVWSTKASHSAFVLSVCILMLDEGCASQLFGVLSSCCLASHTICKQMLVASCASL